MDDISVSEKIRELILPILDREGVELIDMIYRREGRRMALRILADTPLGITISECAELNRKIGEELDGSDIDLENYILEVSSPGLDRLLVTKRDFERKLGKELNVIIKIPVPGKDNLYTGKLEFAGEDNITIRTRSGEEIDIAYDSIAKANQNIAV